MGLTWLKRFGRFFQRRCWDEERARELEAHLAIETEENIARGMSSGEARAAALRKLGNLTHIREEIYEMNTIAFLETLWQDVRYAARTLRKSPGFTAVAIITLALGIGATTAIFSVYDAVVLRTLPVPHPHELVLFSDKPGQGTNTGWQPHRWDRFSSQSFVYFRDHNKSFTDLCAIQGARDDLRVRMGGVAAKEKEERDKGWLVSGNFFPLLGLKAALGRLLLPDDDRPGAPPAAVLNYSYWTRKFHDDPSVLGRVVEINGTAFTIVGVAPSSFSGVYSNSQPDFWLPLVTQPQVTLQDPYAPDPHTYWLLILGRLKPGISLKRAQAEVTTEFQQFFLSVLDTDHYAKQELASSYIQLAPGAWGISYLRRTYSETLQLLMAIVGIILLIVCANLANLLLSRATAREKEISVRLAIGASRRRLVRQLLTESVLLAAMGGALGALVARWGAEICASLVMQGDASGVKGSPEFRVLAFTAGISILAGILFGLIPALRASRADLAAPMKGAAPARLRFGFANSLVVFQVAASLVLLVGAGLFLRTLKKLADQQLGFDEDHVVIIQMDPQAAGYEPKQTPALYQALIDRIEAVPGVRSATVANSDPLSGDSWTSNFAIEGFPPIRDAAPVYKQLVGPHYFETEGIPIMRGRDIGPQDRPGTPLVTVINEAMAKEFFPGMNPIGRRFSLGAPFHANEAMTIVGVAANARYYSLRDAVPPMEFCAAFQVPDANSHNAGYARGVEVRAAGDPRIIETEIRSAIKQVAPNLPVSRVTLLRDQVYQALGRDRSAAELSSAFGALALLLACIGLYGTMAYRVSRRTNEIGIRMTLGAQQQHVLWFVMRECLLLVLAGLAFGVPISLASTRIIAAQLFEVSPMDPLTIALAALILALVAALAGYIPVRRAMRVDPMVALRHE